MQVKHNVSLAPLTAFNVGGKAENLIEARSQEDVMKIKNSGYLQNGFWLLGYGTNCVVSDAGLPGSVIVMRDGKEPGIENDEVIADAASLWDDLVVFSIAKNLWGLELMSGIPGNVGAALVGNIAAYGQKVADSFSWAEVLDTKKDKVVRLTSKDMGFDYRSTALQSKPHLIVLRVAFRLAGTASHELTYSSALKVATKLGLDPSNLTNRRQVIIKTRELAGSIYDANSETKPRTAGSFFKNPLVDKDTAQYLAGFDETGKTVEELLQQNKVHGGNKFRVSAAHVLLAAGYRRGQTWENVRLHPQHVLKLENTGSASSQEIYDVAQEIMASVKEKLSIALEPEVQFIGKF